MTELPSLVLRCGCTVLFRDGETPVCPVHGEQAVVRVRSMPAPRIRGHATGPHVRTEDLGAFTGRIVGGEKAGG
jgi:hypothetical protein